MQELTLTAGEAEAVALVWQRWRRPDVRLLLGRPAPLDGAPIAGAGVLQIGVSPMGFDYQVEANGHLVTGSGREPTWLRWAEARVVA
jgi:hypothetical protein